VGKLIIVAVADVTSSVEATCLYSDVTFTVTTNPTGNEDMVSWSGGGTPSTQSGGATFTTCWSTTGTKTVTARCGTPTATWDKTIDVTVVEVELQATLEDQEVNGVRSGLDETTLVFQLNGTAIPNASLSLTKTTETIDGVTVLTKLIIEYSPSCSELLIPGTNTVQVDIDDMVENHMTPLYTTFDVPNP
jgi:hypothetical protein